MYFFASKFTQKNLSATFKCCVIFGWQMAVDLNEILFANSAQVKKTKFTLKSSVLSRIKTTKKNYGE
jgi:hypothetical protein